MTQWVRTWAVTVGTLRVPAPIRVAFEVERTLRPQPGKASLRIWNLTRDHQAQIEQAAEAQVVIEAGYVGDRGLEQLFRGELFRARSGSGVGVTQPSIRSDRDGVDTVTHIEARDGGIAYQQARVAASFEPGVSASTVLRSCASAMGLGSGNIDDALVAAGLEAETFPEGTVLTGQASRELTRLLAGWGLAWSAQHGVVQVLRRGESLATQAVRLTPATGLLGSPEVGTRGRVKIRTTLVAGLWPGRPVVLESDRANGRFVVQSTKFAGDSQGNEWVAECELAP